MFGLKLSGIQFFFFNANELYNIVGVCCEFPKVIFQYKKLMLNVSIKAYWYKIYSLDLDFVC